MSTYLIGDVQGCLDELKQLLDVIHYNPIQDKLGFLGDLVSRGPKSLETLRFIKSLSQVNIVLGNHDLYCLALGYDLIKKDKETSLTSILHAADKDELLFWLRQQPILLTNKELNYTMVHAGIPPQWEISQATQYAEKIHEKLKTNEYLSFLTNLFTHQITDWSADLPEQMALCYATDAFTRLRFCDQYGTLELKHKNSTAHEDGKYKPWFEWRSREMDIVFGHWAALNGETNTKGFFALDTGCVWGGKLSALRIEDKKIFSVGAKSSHAQK